MNAADFPPGPVAGRAISRAASAPRGLGREYPSPMRPCGAETGRRFQLPVPAVPAAAFTEPDSGAVR